jgi:hypothetical protein
MNDFEFDRGAMRTRLLVAGATLIHASYSGSGDSGMVDEIEAWNAERTVEFPQRMIEQAEAMFYSFLERHFDGWEIDDGSSGVIVWNLKNDTLKIDHTNYYLSSEDETWEEDGWAGDDADARRSGAGEAA